MSDDGANGYSGPVTDVVTLRLRRQPWLLEVGGTVENLVLYRLMLLEALRVIEQQLRLQDAAAFQKQAAEAQHVAALLGKLRVGG